MITGTVLGYGVWLPNNSDDYPGVMPWDEKEWKYNAWHWWAARGQEWSGILGMPTGDGEKPNGVLLTVRDVSLFSNGWQPVLLGGKMPDSVSQIWADKLTQFLQVWGVGRLVGWYAMWEGPHGLVVPTGTDGKESK